MAIRISAEVWRDSAALYARGLSQGDFITLLKVADECREESRRGRVSHTQLAAALHRTVRTAARSLDKLEALGLIRKTDGHRHHLPPEYQIAHPVDGWSFPSAERTPPTSTLREPDPTLCAPRPDKTGPQTRHRECLLPRSPRISQGEDTFQRQSPPRCPAHTRLDGEPPPCRGCRDARVGHAQHERTETRIAALRRAEQRREHALSCMLCDEDGYLVGGALCDHDPESAARIERGVALCRASLRRPSHAPGRWRAPSASAMTPAG